jgi:hypothetical protein
MYGNLSLPIPSHPAIGLAGSTASFNLPSAVITEIDQEA